MMKLSVKNIIPSTFRLLSIGCNFWLKKSSKTIKILSYCIKNKVRYYLCKCWGMHLASTTDFSMFYYVEESEIFNVCVFVSFPFK